MSEDTPTLPVLALIQQIQAGQLSPKTLDQGTRQSCVEVLVGEGYTQPGIAQILQCSDRTIRRDLQDLRDRNGLLPNADLAVALVGEFVARAEHHEAALIRLARNGGASVGERIQAVYCAWRVLNESTQRLQSLGYLPTAPTTVVTELTIHGNDGGGPSFDTLREELVRLETLAEAAGIDTPEARAERQLLLADVECCHLAERLAKATPPRRVDAPDDDIAT